MKSILATALLFSLGGSFSIRADDSMPGPVRGTSALFTDILKQYQSQATQMSSIVMDAGAAGFCGVSLYYGVQLAFPGTWNGQPYELRFWLQTWTAEQMAALFSATNENYPDSGLPACMQSDQLYVTTWSDTEKWILFEPVDQQTGADCGGGAKLAMPLTNCIHANPIYP